MATDGASAAGEAPLSPEPGEAAEKKKGFDVDSLSQSELRFLLSILEGELEARDLVIEALRARTREAFIQERYGKFNLTDPFLALQRDYEAGGEKQKRPICTNPISILEIVMAHCRKMQERMSLQLAAAERRQRKLEFEKTQLQNLEQEHKNVSSRLEEERAKNKHVVLMLVKECKQLSSKIIEESQKLEELMSKLEAEKQKCSELEEALAAEKLKSTQMEAQMEAQMEKQLSEFDTEREQLRAKLCREEAHTKDLKEEIEKMKMVVEHIQRENDCKLNSSHPPKTKELHFVSIGVGVDRPSLQSTFCQTDIFRVDNQTEIMKKSPLTVPAKPTAMAAGNTKMNVCTNSLIGKPGSDRHVTCNDSVSLSSTAHPAGPPHSRTEENGSGSSADLVSSTSLYQNNPAFSTSPASPSYLSSSMHSLQSHCANTTLHSGLNPRVQAARFRFQANANDHDQNGNATQSASTREIPPRDNLAAKQLARNTVTHVLSRFTSPHGGASLRPGLPHSMEVGTYPPVAGRMGHQSFGLKSPTVSRIDRGNPPPIPPKKPGLSQTPSPPHPQLKVIMDGGRSPNVLGKVENKSMSSLPSTSLQGIRGINEETLTKSSSPQLPPKPTIELSVASAGCVIPAMATSQVGAWPPKSPGLKQPACSESSLIISTTIACNSSINPVSASSCRPCDSDSLLVTASGWSPSLTPLLMSGGPAPLGGRPTLLHQAAAQGNVTLLSMLLNEEGTNINYSCEDGYSALYSAAENGHTDCVRLLLTAGAQVDIADKNGFTALCSAAAQGHFRCMELLIEYNANINHAAERGQTPLYLASQNGNSECIKLLLLLGADRGFITSDGRTPIHAAVDSGNTESLNLLLYYDVADGGTNNNDAEPDLGFCDSECREDGSSSKAKPVVSAELINHADNEGWTPAHIAASKGFKDCLEILCNHCGLETAKKDKCNRTVHDVATDDCKELLENLNVLKVHLSISVDEKTHMYCGTDYSESENTICALTIRKQTTWEDFSEAVTQAVINHFHEIVCEEWRSTEDRIFYNDAESRIGLTMNSISSVKLGNASWIPGQIFPNSPWEILKNSQAETVTVALLGPQDGCLHNVSYASMIPLQTLQNFLRLVEQYHNVIFHGPEESLQDYIAHQIALCMKHKHESLGFSCEIVKVELDVEFSKEQLVELFISRECLVPVMAQPPAKRKIVILENLERTSLSELLGDFLEPLENRGPASSCCFQKANGFSDAHYFHENCYLMGTIAKARLQGSDLLVQQHFRWVQLRWDGEPIHGLLKRFLRRKAINKFKGKTPPPSDPVCKSIDWVCSVWHQLNTCLSRLGTPEALTGPRHFLSCPVVPGNAQSIVNWMSKLWNAVIAPRVQEAIFSRASVKRLSPLGQGVGRKPPSQGQQAVVRAALGILLNKAVLHGCPLPRAELDQYTADFRGGSFPLSAVTNYKNKHMKTGGSESWRKVSTSPRKKSSHLSPQAYNTLDGHEDSEIMKNMLQQGSNKKISPDKHKDLQNNQARVLKFEQQSSHGSDDEVDLVQELQSMCFSKSEPDISKIGSSEDRFVLFKDSQKDPVSSTTLSNPQKDGFCPLSSSSSNGTTEHLSASKMGWSDSRVKSLLPVPKNKVSHSSKSTKRSSSNTRQIELNNNSHDEIWNLHKSTQIDKPNK